MTTGDAAASPAFTPLATERLVLRPLAPGDAEALHRLVESYLSLGVKSEAQEAAAVLGYNFPGSDWYQDSYYLMTGEGGPAPTDEKRGWFFGLF